MKKTTLHILLFSLTMGYIQAQGNDNPLAGQDSMVLENERIFDITESHKTPLPYPNRTVKTPDVSEIQYSSKEFRFEFKPQMPEIQPTAYKPDAKATDKDKENAAVGRNYAKIALGQYLTPMAKIHLVNKEKSDLLYAIDLTHVSSHADYSLPFRQFREDYGTFQVGKITKKNRWNVELFLNNTAYNQYAGFGKTDKSKAIKDSLARSFSNADVKFSLASFFDKDKKWAYLAKAAVYNVFETNYIGSDKGNREHTIAISPDLTYYINETFKAGIQTDIAFSNAKITDASQNRIFLSATPFASYEKDALSAKLGASVSYFNPLSKVNNTSRFYAFPIAEIQYAVKPEAIYVFAGLSSGMQNNTYENILQECRYVNRNTTIKPTVEKMNVYIGGNANILSKIDASLRIYYKNLENMLVYYGADSTGLITATYAPTTRNIGTKLALHYNIKPNIKAGLTAEYNNYKVTGIAAAFGKPNFQTAIFSEIALLNNKLNLLPQLYIYGKTPVGLNLNGALINRPITTDLSFKADYQFSKRMSVFVAGNNLLGSKYYRYYGFYERRFNFLAGVSVIF